MTTSTISGPLSRSSGVASAALATLVLVLGLLLATVLAEIRQVAQAAGAGSQPRAASTAAPAPELPREWVWQREAVSFEPMFRSAGRPAGS